MAKRVLVISESFGLGHERAADALTRAMKQLVPDIEVRHTNSIGSSFPRLKDMIFRCYLQLINRLPQTWHRFYENSRAQTDDETSRRMVQLLLEGSITSEIKRFRPHVIVCTHPFPAAVIAGLKEKGLDVPLVGIITDYDVHGYWLNQNIDLYIVGDNSLKNGFTDLNFKPRRVSGQGIPIDPVFAQSPGREEAREKLGLDIGRPVVLVGGGGWGLGALGKITAMLAEMPEGPQVTVVTGINTGLRKVMMRSFSNKGSIKVEGLVDNIHEHMWAADVMVTKPGGLSTTECLASGVPMVLFDVLYGQEVWNARFVTGNGAALKADSIEAIPEKVRIITSDKNSSKLLHKKALLLGKPNSGPDAAFNVLSLAGAL